MKRVKHRYLLLLLDSNCVVSRDDFLESVWGAIERLYGEIGASQTGMALVDYNKEQKTAVIRIALDSLQLVRASIASITRIAGREIAVHVIGLSGTMKSLRRNRDA